jgi:ElaB/YqjD/DUF883 family membrane-anchored ribosome-binding protein
MINEERTSYPTGQQDTITSPATTTTGGDTGLHGGNRTEEPRQRVAGGLDRAASSLRDRASNIPGGQRVQEMARTAANRLENAASYVRDHDMNQMTDDARQVVRKNPAGSILAACAAGFVMGFMLRRR